MKSLPEGFTNGILHIHRIKAFDLTNTELIGSQDPYVKVKVGDYTDKTYTKENGGSDVLFDFLDLKAPVTALLLQKGLIEIEVWDKNSTRADVLIGEGSGLLEEITV